MGFTDKGLVVLYLGEVWAVLRVVGWEDKGLITDWEAAKQPPFVYRYVVAFCLRFWRCGERGSADW